VFVGSWWINFSSRVKKIERIVALDRVNQFVESLRSRQANGAAELQSSFEAVSSLENSSGRGGLELEPAFEKNTVPIFDPQLLSKIGRLELIAKTVVGGFLSGKHRSTHKGGCTDFAGFRPYAPGDDIRQLDWRLYAKSDRYYVRQYDDETNMQALIVVDASGSMQFGLSTVSKWRYAQMASACLGHLLLRQRDSVGLAVVGEGLLEYVRPMPRANHLSRVLKALEESSAAGDSVLDEVLAELTGRLKRRGLVVLISDCFGEVAKLKHVLEQFRVRGHDLLVLQVLAPEELTFPFRREAFFQDLESSQQMQVNPNSLRKQYLIEFQKFMVKLQEAMVDVGGDLVTMTTDRDLGETLSHYLRKRATRKKA